MLVGQGGMDPEYFLNKMSIQEAESFLEGLQNSKRDGWEQSRLIAYMVARVNTTSDIELTDIIRFSWDEKKEKEKITSEEIERLRSMAKEIEKQMNHG